VTIRGEQHLLRTDVPVVIRRDTAANRRRRAPAPTDDHATVAGAD
jgi:hypothetical protein